jgi:glycosyltransferase involved in cell wall biosynthesis
MKHRTLRCSILAVGDFPEGGATSQRLYLLARLLNEGLGDVSLWILHATTKIDLQENRSNTGEWGGVKFVYLNGTTVRPTGTGGALLDTLKGIYRSVRLIASRGADRPDVLVFYTPTFLKFIVPMVMAKFLRIPVIMEICEIYSKSTDKKDTGVLRRLANSGESLMERLIPHISSGALVISRNIHNYYEKLGLPADAMHLLPVLVDSEFYGKSGYTPVENLRGAQFLMNSGSFNEKDGLSYIVEAAAKVRQEYPDIKLVFTGYADVSIQRRILESVSPKGEDWIIFTGFLSREQLIWCYKNARGLLCCRSNSEYANYGFPTKLVEYLASAQPVIVTTVGDVEEYLTDGKSAFLAKPENVESIADAIHRLLRDPVLAERVGHEGAKISRRVFDYRHHASAVGKFIRQRIGIEDLRQ